MAIHFICPACHTSVRASDECGGLLGPCPACKAAIQIPRVNTVPCGGKTDGNGRKGNGIGAETGVPLGVASVDSNAHIKPEDVRPGGETVVSAAGGHSQPGASDDGLHAPDPPVDCRVPGPRPQSGGGGESFIVGMREDAHKSLPVSDPSGGAVTRFRRWRRTARRLRVVVRRLPWWQTVPIIMGCAAALLFSGYIIVGEFGREWEARDRASRQLRMPIAPQRPRVSAPMTREPTARSDESVPVATTETPESDREPKDRMAEFYQIATREEKAQAPQAFDPNQLFKPEWGGRSAKAVDESEPDVEPPSARSAPVSSPRAAIPDVRTDPVRNLLEKDGEEKAAGRNEEEKAVPEVPVAPDRVTAPERPVPAEPPPPVVAVDPPTVCMDCQGSTFVPLPSYRPYVWDYKDPAPDPASAVPFFPCSRCQRGVDLRVSVAAEFDRMKGAPATINEWTRKLKARVECGETRYVSVVVQLQSSTMKGLLQQMDRLTQYVQTTFRSALLTRTRPDTHRLIVVWDRADYDRLIDVLAAEQPEQNWALARRATGRVGRECSFFNAQRGLGTPVEHRALFQFAQMLILEGTDGKAPDWLVEGFASYCENVMLKENLCDSLRPARNEVRLGANWKSEMVRYARQKQLVSWDRILKLDLVSMKPLDDLTCYSMVCFLAVDAARFNTLLVDLRAGVDSQRAIEHAYGRSLDDLQKMWVKWVHQQR